MQRQLAIRLDDVGEQAGHHLLVGHRDDHLAAGAVLEPGQLRADGVVASRRLPHVGRVDDRHRHLLAADAVHLLADDLLDSLRHPEPQREQRVQPRAELAQVAGADEQAVGRHLGVGRVVAERGEEQLAQAHGG